VIDMLFSGLSFARPQWLWLLLVLPALMALFLHAERQAGRRLAILIRSPRLRGQLTGAASAGRRRWRFALLSLGLAGLLAALAGPRWGYEALPAKRQGIDVVLIVDVSKSMLATDLTPNRLTRAKLAAQDLIEQLNGDRIGLVAFAGAAFLQAPMTIDYDAALTSLQDLDVETIPRGGTNLEAAINLALEAFGKTEADNRAIVLMTDGETTEGEGADGLQAAARAAAAGVKIFTVGVGTPEGSLIPLPGRQGDFVRDRDGKIVRSQLDETGLDKIAKAAGGFYLRLQSGQTEMRTIIQDGLARMKSGDIDARQTRRPIERYHWPLGAGLLSLALAALIGERRKARASAALAPVMSGRKAAEAVPAPARLALVLLAAGWSVQSATAAPSPAPEKKDPMTLYHNGQYGEAYREFKELAKKSPDAANLHFDAGASAFKDGDYNGAIEAFSSAMTSEDAGLQSKSHYNFGNTLYQRGAAQKDQKTKLQDWKNAIQHYDSALNLLKNNPNPALRQDAIYNRDLVQKQIEEELKPKPTPPPDKDKDKNKDQKPDKDKDQKPQQKPPDSKDQKDQKGEQNKQPGQQQQPQDQSQKSQNNQPKDKGGSGKDQNQPGSSDQPPQPDPSNQSKDQKPDQSKGGKPEDKQNQPPAGSGKEGDPNNSPPASGGNTSGQPPDPSSIPNQDKPRERGEFQAQPGEKSPQDKGDQTDKELQGAEETDAQPGKMSAGQARALLEALKGEDDRVNLNERVKRYDEPAINDW
jgi:Ca-activated chloride channel family protein